MANPVDGRTDLAESRGGNGSAPASTLRVWCLVGDQRSHVTPIEAHFAERAGFVYDMEPDVARMRRHAPDILVCVNDYDHRVAECLDGARAAGIPSLVIQDGILEWRCQYENPLFGAGGGGAQHQPVLADKIACLGPQSARQIAAWGNADKVEETGSPRLDHLLGLTVPPLRRPGSRILVMTARNPGFTPAQRETTMQSLRDVKAHLEGRRGVEVIWRTRDEVAQALGVDNRLGDASSPDLARLLGSVDAVISTMSTAVLEAMLLKRPVAALDYHNVPRFVATAWTIAAKEHIPAVVDELLQPAPRKLAFQQDVLHDALSCRTPAAPRVADLMVRMARHAADVRRGQAAWPLPAGLIGGRSAAAASPFSLADLYPGHPFFSDTQITSLQARLARLQRRNEQLEQAARRRGLRHGTYLVGKYIAGYFRSRTPQAGA